MKWKVYLASYSLFLTLIFIGAYFNLIPRGLKSVPYYDSLGHLFLYGIWGYLFAKVFPNKIKVFGLSFPIGILVSITIAVIEEFLQLLSSVRTFSLFDLGWGILGILFAWMLVKKENP
jgi:hypothetical protein